MKIEKSTIDFLSELKENNNRDWFLANRERYISAKQNYEIFVQGLIDKLVDIEPILKGLEAKSCVYRINRDVRFSNDKSPYKWHMGAFIVRGGKKNGDRYAGYYFHIEPGASIIAGGSYMPPASWLSSIREKISDNPGSLRKIISDKDFIKYFRELDGDKLKTAPKGYPQDHPAIDLLRFKSYLVLNEVSDKKILTNDFDDYVFDVFRAMKPFNDYLNEI